MTVPRLATAQSHGKSKDFYYFPPERAVSKDGACHLQSDNFSETGICLKSSLSPIRGKNHHKQQQVALKRLAVTKHAVAFSCTPSPSVSLALPRLSKGAENNL